MLLIRKENLVVGFYVSVRHSTFMTEQILLLFGVNHSSEYPICRGLCPQEKGIIEGDFNGQELNIIEKNKTGTTVISGEYLVRLRRISKNEG